MFPSLNGWIVWIISDEKHTIVDLICIVSVSHSSENKQLHTCSECHRQFCSMNAMKRHKLAKHGEHKVSYSCVMCNAMFKTKWSLSTHKSKYHRDKVGMVLPVKTDVSDSTPSTPTAAIISTTNSTTPGTPVPIAVRKLGQTTVTPANISRKTIPIFTSGSITPWGKVNPVAIAATSGKSSEPKKQSPETRKSIKTTKL